MTSRRSFLGSVIGFVGGLACNPMPFAARLFHEPIVEIPKSLPVDPRFRMLFRDSKTGFTIQAPGVMPLIQPSKELIFKAHCLHVVRTMQVDQVVLLNNKGIELGRRCFEGRQVCCVNGDSLNVTYSIIDAGLQRMIEYRDGRFVPAQIEEGGLCEYISPKFDKS